MAVERWMVLVLAIRRCQLLTRRTESYCSCSCECDRDRECECTACMCG